MILIVMCVCDELLLHVFVNELRSLEIVTCLCHDFVILIVTCVCHKLFLNVFVFELERFEIVTCESKPLPHPLLFCTRWRPWYICKNYMIFYFLNLETDLHSIFQYINEILSVICLKDSSLFRLCLLLFDVWHFRNSSWLPSY